jgi:type I restriction enzyme S subunit
MNLSLPETWQTTKLTELAIYVLGGDWGKDADFESPDYTIALCIRGAEFRNWNEDKGATASLRKIKKSSLANRILKDGDILVEISGGGPDQPVGRTVLIDKVALSHNPNIPKVCTNFVRLLRITGEVDSRFINSYLTFFYASGEIRDYQAGSNNLRNLKFNDYLGIDIPIPPLNEQHRIVAKIEELFSELDKGIESLKTAQAQLKVYRQALLKHAFEGKLTAQWRAENQDKLETAEALLKHIQHERAQRYQQQLADWESSGKQGSKPKAPKVLSSLTAEELAELQELPKGWTWVKYGELIENSQNGISKRSGSTGQEVIVLRLADIFEQKVTVKNSRKIMLTEKELDNYRLNKNDLLCIRVNGSPDLVGRMVTIEEDTNIAYCDHFIRYRLLTNIFNSKYLSSYFNTVPIRRYIDLNKVSSAGQNTVNQEMIGSITIAFCCKAEQEVIVELLEEKLSEVDYLNETITTSLQQAEALRQSILKKAFSGQLVPQDPNDQPASILLARIKAEKIDNDSSKTNQRQTRKESA